MTPTPPIFHMTAQSLAISEQQKLTVAPSLGIGARGAIAVSKIGQRIYLDGTLQGNKAYEANTWVHDVLQLPAWAYPAETIVFACNFSSATAVMQVADTGKISFYLYEAVSTYMKGNSVTLGVSWLANNQ